MTPPLWHDRLHHAAELRQAALAAVNPAEAVRRHLMREEDAIVAGGERVPLAPGARAFVVGAGKAGVAMAEAARAILGPRLIGGCLSVPRLPDRDLAPLQFIRGGHPVPDDGTLAAGRRIAEILAETRPDDVVVALISGGGSALLELPLAGITLADLQATTHALLRCGATIVELNCVRKSLSQIKGGGLARMAAPARVIGLILSDVVGDPLDVIASAPTLPESASPADALSVFERYGIAESIPPSIINSLRQSVFNRQSIRNPQSPITNRIIGSNTLAALAAVERAASLGFNSLLLSTFVEGEAREVGRVVAGLAKGIRRYNQPFAPRAGLVLGGETTVTIRGDGVGGRNQELALAAAIALEGWERVMVM
ncbi:MAG: DUF4147 domain-containing protein, partial [Chloroflexi bacterium]|nr:DUF4147 domain-containing protein [Chloroflexota bacterium]